MKIFPQITSKHKNSKTKVTNKHQKRANGVFWQLLAMFINPVTKKCTKTNIFETSSVKNPRGPPTLSLKIQG
jgi:hypothetical protein